MGVKNKVIDELFVSFGEIHENTVPEHFAPTMKLRFIERAIPLPGEDNVGKVVRILQQQYRGTLGNVKWEDVPLVKE